MAATDEDDSRREPKQNYTTSNFTPRRAGQGMNEDHYQGLTKKSEDQNLSGDIRSVEDKAKRKKILNKVGVEDQTAFNHRDQLPACMEAYKYLVTSYVKPLWVTNQY